MPSNKLNLEALVAALDAKRRADGISWRDVAERTGVSPSTLTRLQQDRRPDIDTFAALVSWLQMSADAFFSPEIPSGTSATATAAHHQRGKSRSKPTKREEELLSELLRKAHELAQEWKR